MRPSKVRLSQLSVQRLKVLEHIKASLLVVSLEESLEIVARAHIVVWHGGLHFDRPVRCAHEHALMIHFTGTGRRDLLLLRHLRRCRSL